MSFEMFQFLKEIIKDSMSFEKFQFLKELIKDFEIYFIVLFVIKKIYSWVV